MSEDPEIERRIIELQENEEKLKLMEVELKKKCDEFDDHVSSKKEEFNQRECELVAKEEKLISAVSSLNASERFMKIQQLLDEVYTLFVAAGGKPEDLHESIKLVLEARSRFSVHA